MVTYIILHYIDRGRRGRDHMVTYIILHYIYRGRRGRDHMVTYIILHYIDRGCRGHDHMVTYIILHYIDRGRRGHDYIVVLSTTTCVIRAYHLKFCEFESCSLRGVLDTTLCDKVCRWFSPGTCHNITEILLKVKL
jgi:hypothetical protein